MDTYHKWNNSLFSVWSAHCNWKLQFYPNQLATRRYHTRCYVWCYVFPANIIIVLDLAIYALVRRVLNTTCAYIYLDIASVCARNMHVQSLGYWSRSVHSVSVIFQATITSLYHTARTTYWIESWRVLHDGFVRISVDIVIVITSQPYTHHSIAMCIIIVSSCHIHAFDAFMLSIWWQLKCELTS